MKDFADEMVAVGKHLVDEEIICYILTGLDFEFNPFVETFTAKIEPQTLNDLYSQLLITEAHVESQKEHRQINVNAAYRSGRGGGGRGDGNFCGGRGGGRGRGGGNKTPCQVFRKTGHSALRCYKHFDANYNGKEKQAHAVTTGYNANTNWYTDPDATDHITFELDKLTTREKYPGSDQVHATNGQVCPFPILVTVPFIAVIEILSLRTFFLC
jgi:hypothetical protein